MFFILSSTTRNNAARIFVWNRVVALQLKKIVQCDMPWLALNFAQRHRVAGEVDQCDMHRPIARKNRRRKSFSVTPALGNMTRSRGSSGQTIDDYAKDGGPREV